MGRWVLVNNTSANAARRDIDTPAPTLYFGARLNSMWWVEVDDEQDDDEPCPS